MEAALTSSLGRTILGSSVLTIGRARDNGLVVSDRTVSSHHAEIRPVGGEHMSSEARADIAMREGQGYSIVDLGSTNGTFVNGQRLVKNTPRLLHTGDTIRLGDFTLTYEEEYPTSWTDNTNATAARGETTGTQDSPRSAWGSLPAPSASAPLGWDDEEEAWEQPLQQAPSSFPPTVSSPAPQQGYQFPSASSQQPSTVYGASPPVAVGKAGSPQFGTPRSVPPEQAQPKNLAQEHLQFTAFHPRVVPVETWKTLLVYAYIESALQAIRADAHRFRDQLGPDPFKADAWASRLLTRGTSITIVPTLQGVTFNPERIALTWVKDWHPAIFSFNANKGWARAVGSGEITIFAGPVIIASLKISLRFEEQTFQPTVRDSRNQEEVSASPYRKVFTSYSHADTPIVLAIRKASEVIGDESLLDIENLRSGQNWKPSLLRMIDNADIFQLFWSDRSAQSPYVYQECQYALQHYKYDGFIRPVYWEKPMRRPPPELSHLHFAYYELPRLEPTGKKNSLFSRFFKGLRPRST